MDFKEYKKAYTKQALALGVSLDAIGVAMEYAEQLHTTKLDDIKLDKDTNEIYYQLQGTYDKEEIIKMMNGISY